DLVSAQVRSAVAFDDQETAREIFDAVAGDQDVSGLVLFTATGETLHSWGSLSKTGQLAKSGVEGRKVYDLGDLVLAVAPVISLEGPRGTLALELSKTRFAESVSATQLNALLIGGVALLLGLGFALWLARSFAARLRTIADTAQLVAAGDLSV